MIWNQVLILFFKTSHLLNTGNVTSIGALPGFKDGFAEEAQFYNPAGITVSESDGSLLVCDCRNNKIRKITFEGITSMLFLSV